MDIIAMGGGFGLGMSANRFEYEWTDKGLALWSHNDDPVPVNVTTYSGIFVETVDAKGNVINEGGDGQWYWVTVGPERVTLRFKTLPDPNLSKRELNRTRKKVTRYLVSDMSYNVGIPDNLTEAISWMHDRLNDIPEKCRRSAKVRFDTLMEYGETYPHFEIIYQEPESDEEVIRRVQVERERARLREAAERAKLAQLQQKYNAA